MGEWDTYNLRSLIQRAACQTHRSYHLHIVIYMCWMQNVHAKKTTTNCCGCNRHDCTLTPVCKWQLCIFQFWLNHGYAVSLICVCRPQRCLHCRSIHPNGSACAHQNCKLCILEQNSNDFNAVDDIVAAEMHRMNGWLCYWGRMHNGEKC